MVLVTLAAALQRRRSGIKTTLFENKLQQPSALKIVLHLLPATLVSCLRGAKQKCYSLTHVKARFFLYNLTAKC
jgi:hypothetical protein